MTLQRLPAAPGDDSGHLVVEFSRLLCDYGPSGTCRDDAGKIQASYGVDGWSATGRDAASRMRQEDRGTTDAPQQMDNGLGVEVVCP